MATMLSIAEVTGTSLTRCIAESRETPLSGSIRRACLLKRGSDYQLRPRLNDLDQLAMLGELPLEPAAGYKVMVEMNRSSLAIIGRTEHHLVFRAVAGHGGRHEDGTLVGNPEGPPPFGIALLFRIGNGKPMDLDHLLGLEGQQCRMRQRVSLDRCANLIEHVLGRVERAEDSKARNHSHTIMALCPENYLRRQYCFSLVTPPSDSGNPTP